MEARVPKPSVKAEFIKARPTASVQEVIDAAKKAGMELSSSYVQAVRNGSKGINAVSVVNSKNNKRLQLERLVIEVGLEAAEDVVERVKARLMSLQ